MCSYWIGDPYNGMISILLPVFVLVAVTVSVTCKRYSKSYLERERKELEEYEEIDRELKEDCKRRAKERDEKMDRENEKCHRDLVQRETKKKEEEEKQKKNNMELYNKVLAKIDELFQCCKSETKPCDADERIYQLVSFMRTEFIRPKYSQEEVKKKIEEKRNQTFSRRDHYFHHYRYDVRRRKEEWRVEREHVACEIYMPLIQEVMEKCEEHHEDPQKLRIYYSAHEGKADYLSTSGMGKNRDPRYLCSAIVSTSIFKPIPCPKTFWEMCENGDYAQFGEIREICEEAQELVMERKKEKGSDAKQKETGGKQSLMKKAGDEKKKSNLMKNEKKKSNVETKKDKVKKTN